MGVYTDKLKEVNKGFDELIFLLKLSIEKKEKLENLVKELNNYDNEIIKSRAEMRKGNMEIEKALNEVTNCNKEFVNHIFKTGELEGLTCQLSYLDELKLELERIYDTFK